MDPIHGLAGALSALVIWVLISSVVAGKDPYLDFTCVASKALIPTASSASKALIPTASSASKALISTASSASQILIEVYTPLRNATVKIDDEIGISTRTRKPGPHVCSLEKENLEATTTVILSSEDANLYPPRLTETLDPDEEIILEMILRHGSSTCTEPCKYRWSELVDNDGMKKEKLFHINGLNKTSIVLRNFLVGARDKKGFVQVLVRECPSGYWNPEENCALECSNCLNGGMCHPRSGQCICPPGFSGVECEIVHGRNIFGQEGQYSCNASSDPQDNDCKGKLFCLPEPFGCTCGAGYRGIDCSEGCGIGTYGANCEGVCHCKDNSTCLADTGECDASSCQDGWFGTNCQDRGPVLYKELKELEINQTTNVTCILRNVKNPNDSDIVLILPNGTAIEANYFIEYETPVMADYIFVVVAHEVDNEYTCVYNNITLQTEANNIMLQTEANNITLQTEANNITLQTEANLVASVQGPTLIEKLTEVNINQTTNVTCILGNVKNPNDSDIMLILPNGMTIEADYITEDEIPTKTEFIFVVVANASQNEFTCTYANMTLQKAFHLTAFEPPYLTNPPTINSSKVNEIIISWTPWETQPGDKGDPPVVNYIITYKEANETNATTTGVTQGDATSYTVVGLIEDTKYEFRVTAVRPGVGGAGPPSPPAYGNTTCRVPGKPVNFTGKALNATSLQLNWSQPINTVCSVITYNLTYWLKQQGECEEITKGSFEQKQRTTVNRSLVIGDLLPDTLYKVKIVAISSAGKSTDEAPFSYKTSESVPGPPESISTVPENYTLNAKWEAPGCAVRNGKILGYHYQLLISGETIAAEGVTKSTVGQHTFDNLSPCTKYGFRVRGRTSAGNGSFSQIQNVTTLGAVPDEVTDIQVSSNSSTTLHVSWSAPTNPPCPVTNYSVAYTLVQWGQCEELEDVETNTIAVSDTKTALEMLHPDSEYVVVVRAETVTGSGNGVDNTGRTLEDAPGRPVAITNTTKTSMSVTFTWQPPACRERNGAITGYTYKLVHTTSKNKLTETSVSSDVTSASIDGLTACTKYHFKVLASTSVGNSSFSDAVYVTTDGEAPDAVGDLLTEPLATSIHLNWTKPKNTLCDIISYKVTYKLIKVLQCIEEENTDIQEIAVTPPSTQRMIFGLLPASKYMVSVKAETEGGFGEEGLEEVLTLESAPGRPVVIRNTTKSSRSVTFTWQPPACRERNGAITGYTYKLVHTTSKNKLTETSVSQDVTSASFDGLTACTKYHFKVLASTSVANSSFTDAFEVTTASEAPDAVGDLLTEPLATSIHLNWTKPKNTLCDIISYKVTYKLIKVLQCIEEENTDIQEPAVTPPSTQHTIYHLLPASKYMVSVKAETKGGLGEERMEEVITLESVPGKPVAINNTLTSSRSVTFTWQPPACRQRNGAIIAYIYKLVNTTTRNKFTEYSVSPNVTSASINGLTPCTKYHFKVRANTSAGYSPFSGPVYVTTDGEVPDVVSNVQVSSTSDSIQVTWEPPTKVSCDITNYLISYKLIRYHQCSEIDQKSREHSVMVGSAERVYTIPELSAASDYLVSVRANTTSGLGDVVNINVSTPESAPESVTNVTLTDVGPFNASFSWSPPMCEDMHGRIISYSYDLVTNDTETIAGNTTDEVISFEMLTPCTFYGFTVAAWTSAGMGHQSKPLNFTTNATDPGQVSIIKKNTFKNATAVRIKWLSPTSSENPCSIENYTVMYYLKAIKQCTMTSKETFIRVTTETNLLLVSLRPNSVYMVSVKASTIAGLGPPEEKQVTTRPDAPGQITDVMVSNTTTDSIQFTWGELDCESQHDQINGYNYEFKVDEVVDRDTDNGDDDDDDDREGQTSVLFAVFSDLKSCTEYKFRVQAIGENNNGTWSNWVKATTSTAVPEKVSNLMLQRGDDPSSIIQVSWQPSDKDDCKINEYQVMYNGESFEVCSPRMVFNSTSITVRTHSATLRNLMPYSKYNVTVRGKTTAGLGKMNTRVKQTAQGIPSAPPENISLVDRGPNHLKFTWQPPICGQQNGMIVNYTYTLAYNNETVKNTTVATEAFLDDLIPFVGYDFTVRANTKKGSGPLGNLTVETAEGVPSPPRNFHAVKSETTRLEYTWDPPYPPTGVISAYRFMYWLLDENSAVTVDYEMTTNRVHSYFLQGLKPYMDYNIKIRGKTGAGFGAWSETLTNRTAEDAPEQPTSVAVADRTTTTLSIQWNCPENINGILKGYKMEYRIVDQPFAVSPSGSGLMEVSISSDASSHRLKDLDAATGYEIKLAAMTVKRGEYSTLTPIYTKIPVIAKPKMLDAPSVGDDNMVTLQLEAMDSPYVSVYQVTIAKVKSESTISRREVGDSALGSYQQSQDEYITAEFNKTALPSKFKVGDNKTYNGYYNAPLDPGTSYGIQFCGVGKTKQDTNPSCTEPLPVKTRELGTGMGQIIGVIFGILVVMAVVVLVLAVVIRKRRQADKMDNTNGITLSNLEKAKPKTNGAPTQSAVVEELVRTELRRSGGVKGKSTTPLPQPTKVSPPPKKAWKPHKQVSLQDLPEYIKKKKAKGNKGFSHDFASLPDEQLHSCDVAQKEEQRCKNRYANIIPYDCTRVLLDVLNDDQDTDFVNASYIDGYQRKNAYIATQGPNKSSSPDFWRMVWEQEVLIVVMLTNLVENAKKKCIQYWPDEQKTYGDIVVKLISEKVKKDYTERSFVISNINIDEDIPREIKQFHYTSWPDMGLPDSPAPLMKFIHEVKQNEDDNKPSPMVVHCSAGVGRTGTFITVDAMLNMVAEEKQINVIDFVYQMRKHRMKMVQTMDQYMFIFEVLVETLLCGETVMEAATFPTQYAALHDRNPLTGNKYVEEHFRVLDTMSVAPSDDNCHGGRNEMNVNKNRFHDCIPLDKCRPYLMSPGEDDNSTNYINASFIDAYKKKDGFLATQSPLPNTVVDFWRMIYDYNARVIVMLNEIEGSEDETLQPYWLDNPEETAALGIFELQLRDRKDFNHTIARTFKLKNTNKISEKPRTIHHFEFKKWKEEEEFPESKSSFVCFLELVEQGQRQSGGDGRTAVHCLDGVTRSGIFCATMVALKKLKEEKLIDIFHAVRNLRRNRDVMVESQDHYLFCYEVIKVYLEENEVYANFR